MRFRNGQKIQDVVLLTTLEVFFDICGLPMTKYVKNSPIEKARTFPHRLLGKISLLETVFSVALKCMNPWITSLADTEKKTLFGLSLSLGRSESHVQHQINRT